jgi:hypothetical protein
MRKLARVAGLTGVLTLVVAAAARAAPPEHFPVEHVDATLTIEGQCSFPVVRRIEGDVRLTRFVDGAGNTIRFLTTYANFRVTFTNADTGSSFTTASPAVEEVTVNLDGSFVVTSRGLVGHVIAGGQRPVSDVGRVVLFFSGPEDEEPDVLFQAGQTSGHGAFPAVCDVLAAT